MLFHSLGLPRKIRCVLRVKIVLGVNSAFLVRVKGIDTDCLIEEKEEEQQQEKEHNNNNNNNNKTTKKKKKKK